VSYFFWEAKRSSHLGKEVLLVNTRQDVNLYKEKEHNKVDSSSAVEGCCGSSSAREDVPSSLALSLGEYDLNDWIG
jgi:Na+-transporting NADH:ubiquinone oxidoreductase subunit NqrC